MVKWEHQKGVLSGKEAAPRGRSEMGGRLVTVDHNEMVRAVQQAMAQQLQKDGRLRPGMELGLIFFSQRADEVQVVGRVRSAGQVLFELKGARPHLSAVATQLALAKLSPAERSGLQPSARVHWRTVRFTSEQESIDRFMVDVEFQPQPQGASG